MEAWNKGLNLSHQQGEKVMKVLGIKKIQDEIYIRNANREELHVDPGWKQGCSRCHAYKGLIEDVMKRHGDLAACRFALEHLTQCVQKGQWYCEDCLSIDEVPQQCLGMCFSSTTRGLYVPVV